MKNFKMLQVKWLNGSLIVLVIVHLSYGVDKPAEKYFNICSRNDEGLNECIQNTIMAAREELVRGVPDLKLPPIDPMDISKMELREGDGSLSFFMVLKKVSMEGLRHMKIKEFKMEGKNFSDVTFKFILDVPYLHFEGQYEMGGRILVFPIKGNGDFFFNFTSVLASATMKGHEDVKKFLEVDEMTWDMKVGGGKCHFSNLFNSEKTIGAATNRFLNAHFNEVFSSLKYLPEKAFGGLIRDYCNLIFSQFPLDMLILP